MATAPNPLYDLSAVVTNAGLAAASVATPTGPWINITKFKIGDGYGYQANRNDLDINGNVLYEAPVTAYRNVPPKTINVMCSIPAIEGPFQFGELGLYVPSNSNPSTDVLFAKLVFPTPQLKTSSLVTNVASTYTFNCLIDLEQSTAIFQINNGELQTIWVVNKWSDVYPQSAMANPAIDLIVVQEADPYGRSTALVPASPNGSGLGTQWTPQGTYRLHSTHSVVSSTPTTVTVSSTPLAGWPITGRPNHTFVIQLAASGLFRAVTSVTALSGNLYRFNLAADQLASLPAAGSSLTLWESDAVKDQLMTDETYGLGHPGDGLVLSSPGVFEVHGLLHGAPGTGRQLTSSDNLNTEFASGVYNFEVGSRPANLPTDERLTATQLAGGHVLISNFEGHLVQVVYYWGSGDPDVPIFWRILGRGSGSTWSPWRSSGGSFGSSGTLTYKGSINNSSFSETSTSAITTYTITNNRESSHIYIYVDGNVLLKDDGEGGGGLSITVPQGKLVQLSHQGNSENCPIYSITWD